MRREVQKLTGWYGCWLYYKSILVNVTRLTARSGLYSHCPGIFHIVNKITRLLEYTKIICCICIVIHLIKDFKKNFGDFVFILWLFLAFISLLYICLAWLRVFYPQYSNFLHSWAGFLQLVMVYNVFILFIVLSWIKL